MNYNIFEPSLPSQLNFDFHHLLFCVPDNKKKVVTSQFQKRYPMEKRKFFRLTSVSKFLHYLNLETDVDSFEVIHNSVEKDAVFKGTNLWILVFAILIASVGLNMNSTAVIIGAMLISPLMGPINALGYSIATYNFELFRKAVKNFSFAVVAGIFASTLYFSISPISTAHSELLARTSPSIYDVLIAFFGGLAGIVAISTKNKGNVIPGVAIATALMPPLCTSGYGLATGQLTYFFGAIYLFTINTVFIALSALIVSQYLKFPIRSHVPENRKKHINNIITTIIVITIVPSIYFGFTLVQKENFNDKATRFVRNVSAFEGNFLLKNEISHSENTIKLTYGGSKLTDQQKKKIEDKLYDFELEGTNIVFEIGFSFDDIIAKNSELDNLKAEIVRLQGQLEEKESDLYKVTLQTKIGQRLFLELEQLYPEIVSLIYTEMANFISDTEVNENFGLVIVETQKRLKPLDREKIAQWLRLRLESDELKIIFQPEN